MELGKEYFGPLWSFVASDEITDIDYNGNTVGAIVTVPCTFGTGVYVSNNYSKDMKVRELYRIEFNNVFG